MGINDAVVAIEKFLVTYDGGTGRPTGVQVRPSGDEVDVIKIRVELGGALADSDAWEHACAAAIREALPDTHPFRLEVHAEGDPG